MTVKRFNICCRRQIHFGWVICLTLLPSLDYPLEKASEDELALVNVAELIPGVVLDIRYATKNNLSIDRPEGLSAIGLRLLGGTGILRQLVARLLPILIPSP